MTVRPRPAGDMSGKNRGTEVSGGSTALLPRTVRLLLSAEKWEADRSPSTPEEEPHPRFVEAIQKKAYVEYLLDLFLYESEEEQKVWIAEHTTEITHLERRLKIMAENKPTNRERLREITDGIEQGIKELFESEKYMRYLSVMSRFHRYSVNNTMLIYMQKPDATLVAGYNKWKDQFERHVKRASMALPSSPQHRTRRKSRSRSWTRIPRLRFWIKTERSSQRKRNRDSHVPPGQGL